MTRINYNRPIYQKQAMNKKCKYPPMHLDSQFGFGKYKGTSLLWVMENDSNYVDWLMGEKAIELDNEAYSRFKQIMIP